LSSSYGLEGLKEGGGGGGGGGSLIIRINICIEIMRLII
jgi:hypothetical protein